MKITIFSSNQPRHINLARQFSNVADQVYFISEVNTVFPGQIDDFYRKSEVMQLYFQNVISSERKIFGDINFLPKNVMQLSIKSGDLNSLKKNQLEDALNSEYFIVFGASYIKGWLIDFLVDKKAINIHMGLSPYYRGSSCNFWALYDNNPHYVGATIHLLSKGLDNGDILFHCMPNFIEGDTTFDYSMRSVLAAQNGLVHAVTSKEIFSTTPIKQDKNEEIRYSKNYEFTDSIAQDFLNRNISLEGSKFSYPHLINPYFG